MQQVTLRIDDDLARRLKRAAADSGRSVNGYVGDVMRAAVDPDLAGDEADRLRARLAQAGILAPGLAARQGAPSAAALAGAQRRAGRGRSLADLVGEGRG